MAFQPAPAVAQAVMRYGFIATGEFLWANVFNFVHNGGTAWTLAELIVLADTLTAWWTMNIAPLTVAGYGLMTVEVRGMDSQEAPYFTRTVNDNGDVAGEALPLNVAAVITLRTGLTGRSARGRIYHAGLSEVQTEGSTLTAGVVTGLNDAYGELLAAVSADTAGSLCVLSRTTNGAERPTASPRVVLSASLRDAVLDTQRRRINRLK